VIGVAAGAAKAPTILAALRGGLVNALIVDDSAASEVLRLAEEEG
jgi:DNA-binding transcriptional regulator LsrR (DeoR family)